MFFLLTLIGVLGICLILSQFKIKNHDWLIYLISLVINCVGIYIVFFTQPESRGAIIIQRIFMQGLVGMSLFVIVMFIGALPPKKLVVDFLRIRAELSILAVIWMMPHFFFYIVNLSKAMVNWPKLAPVPFMLNMFVSILSLWAWIICIPLFITSFRSIRGKMTAKAWKNMQRYAYLFYALVYIHIMIAIFNRPDYYNYKFTFIVYTAIFFAYGALRLRKYASKLSIDKNRRKKAFINCLAILLTIGLGASVASIYTGCSLKAKYAQLEDTAAKDAKLVETLNRKLTMKEEIEEIEEDVTSKESIFKDGTYEGTGKGYKSDIKVKVVVEKGRISKVELVSHGDDQQYFDMAQNVMSDIVTNNTTEVDTVGGATFSSAGIIKAVEDALDKAVKK